MLYDLVHIANEWNPSSEWLPLTGSAVLFGAMALLPELIVVLSYLWTGHTLPRDPVNANGPKGTYVGLPGPMAEGMNITAAPTAYHGAAGLSRGRLDRRVADSAYEPSAMNV